MNDGARVAENGAAGAPADAASRRVSGMEDGLSMDPAQQSLADALRITFRIIQFVMVLLVALFLLSGFDTIGEGQSGIRLTFGRVKDANLSSGRQFHLPYPIGELIKVSAGQRTLDLDQSFYPDLTEGQRARGIEALAGDKRTLRPGVDGSNLTGDGSIAHSDWTVVYRVDDAFAFTQNMRADDVDTIVQSVVERGVVQAMAEISVDELLRQSAGPDSIASEGSAIESMVRQIARESLDAMNSGIRIERITLNERIPPIFVYEDFQSVSTSEADAARDRENALRQSRDTLTRSAGSAYPQLLELIDQYELHLASEQASDAAETLAEIDRMIEGAPGRDDTRVSGEVSGIINEAREYRTDVLASARATASRFNAKLEQYRTNPSVFVATEWRSAFQSFLAVSMAEVFPIPANSSLVEMIINPDPDVVREMESERNLREASETIGTRLNEVRDRRRRAAQNNQ